MASQNVGARVALPPPTAWIYCDGAVIQGIENGPQLILPVDSMEDRTLVVQDEQRHAIEYQCLENSIPAIVIDAKGEQYMGALMCGDHSESVTLKITNKETGKAALVTFRNYQQINQDLSYNKWKILTNYQGRLKYSYRTAEVSWRCLAEAQLYENNKIIIQTYAAIQSCADKPFQARVKIVTGVLGVDRRDSSPIRNRKYGGPMLASMSMASAPNFMDPSEGKSTNEDLLVHDVGVKNLSGLVKLPLAESAVLDSIKVYFSKTYDQNLTYAGYRVTVKDVVPACQLTVSQTYSDSSKVLGIVDIKEHRPGETLDIKLSASTAVRVETIVVTISEQTTAEDIARSLGIIPTKVWRSVTEMINVKINNNTTVRQTVILSHNLGDSILLESSMKNGEFKYNDKSIEIPIRVEPPANPGEGMDLSIIITTGRLMDIPNSS